MHKDLLFGIEKNENKNPPFWRYFALKTIIDILEKKKIDVFASFLTEIKNEKNEKKKQSNNISEI